MIAAQTAILARHGRPLAQTLRWTVVARMRHAPRAAVARGQTFSAREPAPSASEGLGV
jgi:hypothetical protein